MCVYKQQWMAYQCHVQEVHPPTGLLHAVHVSVKCGQLAWVQECLQGCWDREAVFVRETCICVYVWERERERDVLCVCVRERYICNVCDKHIMCGMHLAKLAYETAICVHDGCFRAEWPFFLLSHLQLNTSLKPSFSPTTLSSSLKTSLASCCTGGCTSKVAN